MTPRGMDSTDERNLGSTAVPPADLDRVFREAQALLCRQPPDSVAQWVCRQVDRSRARSILQELAIAEYDRRREGGQEVDIEELTAAFGLFHSSIRRQLDVERFFWEHCGGPGASGRAEPKWPKAGQRFLHFQLLELIGRGSFARVYLASDESLGQRQVVLKLVPDARQEAALLGRLSHPHIVCVHGVFREPGLGLSGICMEFAGRLTLFDLLDLAAEQRAAHGPTHGARAFLTALAGTNAPKALDTASVDEYHEAVARIGLQLAEALAHAHSLGILHLDLKPSNILIGFDGQTRLLDFNLSVDLSQPLSRIGGTLAYMAPELVEQLAGSREPSPQATCSPRSDIYSLGAMLHELLVGQPPFLVDEAASRNGGAEMVNQLCASHQAARSALTALPSLERDRLLRIVRQCIALAPEARPTSMNELAAELRRYLSWRGRVARWTSRHRRPLGWLTLTTCLLSVAMLAALWHRDPADVRWRRVGEAAFARGDFQAAQQAFRHALELTADNPQLLRSLARSQQRSGDIEGALRTLASSDQISRDPAGLTERAYYYLLAREPRQALIESLKAHELGADSRAFLNNLGYAYQATGRSTKALVVLNQATEKYPEDATIRLNRGVTLLGSANERSEPLKAALDDFETACRTKSDCGMPYELAARASVRLARLEPAYLDRAWKHLRPALKHGLDPGALRNDGEFQILGADKLESLIAGKARLHADQYDCSPWIDPADEM